MQSSPPQRGGYGHLKVRSVSPTLPFTKPTSTPKALFVRHRPPSVTKRGSGQREKRVWYGNSMLADQERGCCRGFQGRSQREPTPRPLNLTEVSSPPLPKGKIGPRQGTVPPDLVPVPPLLPEGRQGGRGSDGNISIRQGKPRGPVPEGKAASMFEVTLITESANHKRYRVSLRSSSKRVPSNPSPNGVGFVQNGGSEPLNRTIRVLWA